MSERKGFTLIELLVVIAIIAILAAILFPVFAQAREKARQTTCLSNGKQIGLATMMYVNDYDEMFPMQQWRDWGDAQVPGRRRAWTMDIAPYVKAGQYGTSGHGAARGVGGIFICPSHPDPKQVFHYGVHESLFRGCWWGSPSEIQPCGDPSASLAQIDRPAEIAMVLEKGRADFQDVQPDGTSNSWPFFMSAGHVWAWENPAAGWPNGPANRNATGVSYPNPDRDWAPRTWDGRWPHSAVMPRFRHSNTTTTVFTDGHAKSMQKGRLNWVDHIYVQGLNSWGSAR